MSVELKAGPGKLAGALNSSHLYTCKNCGQAFYTAGYCCGRCGRDSRLDKPAGERLRLWFQSLIWSAQWIAIDVKLWWRKHYRGAEAW